MNGMNPIKKNEPFKYSWFNKPPIVPNDTALVLYPHDSKEHCNVYLQEDTVYTEAIRKWHLDRIAHITLDNFEFQHQIRFNFSSGTNQWINIEYNFIVSVKPEKDAVKYIIRNNVTDVSEAVLENLNSIRLDRNFEPIEIEELKSNALQKIKESVSKLTYLKIQVKDGEYKLDEVSKKQIEADIEDRLRVAQNEATHKKLIRDKEEALIRNEEVEVAKTVAEKENELTRIWHKQEMEAQQYDIEKKLMEGEAERKYQLQKEDNIAAVAEKQNQNILTYGIEKLAAIDPQYKEYIRSHQEMVDMDRENQKKDFELASKKIELLKDLNDAGAIDGLMIGKIAHYLLCENSQMEAMITSTPENIGIEDNGELDLSEDGKDVV